MGNELTGILSGTGAKMKGEVMADHVVFRGAVKAEVPFEEITAEARGTLLILSFRGHVVELGAGAKASALAAQVRSPPSRLDRLGVQYGASAAVAGPFDPKFKDELGTRAVVAQGAPKTPVDLLFLAVEAKEQLELIAKVAGLVAPSGTLWVVVAKGEAVPPAKAPGFKAGTPVRFDDGRVAVPLRR